MPLSQHGRSKRVRALAAGLVAAWVCTLPLPLGAQDYPIRDIHTICGFAAGSGADILVRYYSDKLSKLAGRPVIVENRAGAQGTIAAEYVARAKPDGYTVLVTPASSTLAAASYTFKKLPYHPIKDFVSVAPIARLSFVIAVPGSSPIKSLPELVAHLKTKPDHGTYGEGTVTGQVVVELLKERAGLKTVDVPYKTSVQGITDLLGGQIDFLVWDATFLSGQARSGRIRLLGLTSGTRSAALPDVPTIAEAGFPGYDITSWWGVLLPAGTPRPVVDRLASWIGQINAADETRQFLHNVATDVLTGTPDSMAALLKEDIDRWGRYAKLARIQPQ
jgi:tripartite-type tricarboxylate transporter receptor subunit TctC